MRSSSVMSLYRLALPAPDRRTRPVLSSSRSRSRTWVSRARACLAIATAFKPFSASRSIASSVPASSTATGFRRLVGLLSAAVRGLRERATVLVGASLFAGAGVGPGGGSAGVAVAVASLAEVDDRRRLGSVTAPPAPAGPDRARDAPLL